LNPIHPVSPQGDIGTSSGVSVDRATSCAGDDFAASIDGGDYELSGRRIGLWHGAKLEL